MFGEEYKSWNLAFYIFFIFLLLLLPTIEMFSETFSLIVFNLLAFIRVRDQVLYLQKTM